MKRHLALVIACAVCSKAIAETAEYQVRRLVYLQSSCGVESLTRLDSPSMNEHFKVMCKNVSAYPNGLEVVCTDPSDDRSCKILTPAVTFDQLELLQPKKPVVP